MNFTEPQNVVWSYGPIVRLGSGRQDQEYGGIVIKIITTMKDVGLLVYKKRVEDRHRTVVNGGVLVPGKGQFFSLRHTFAQPTNDQPPTTSTQDVGVLDIIMTL